MGTNYYILDNSEKCNQCGHGEKRIHIGKSSDGWCFALHVFPPEINDLQDWIEIFKKNQIIDEYGSNISIENMIETITLRSVEKRNLDKDFHRYNFSQDGPNGLVRSIRDPAFCIGHGDGTWDLMVGDFS